MILFAAGIFVHVLYQSFDFNLLKDINKTVFQGVQHVKVKLGSV
jgi:hypothetical protein